MGRDKLYSEDAIGYIIVFGFLSIVAFLFMFSGIKLLLNTIAIIEYGIVVPASVNSIKEWLVRNSSFAGKFGIVGYTKYKRGCITCRFTDSSGKSYSFQVYSRKEHQLNKGDSIPVIYDPGMPENVLAIDVLPWFVKSKFN
jgi:hypothetical protein